MRERGTTAPEAIASRTPGPDIEALLLDAGFAADDLAALRRRMT